MKRKWWPDLTFLYAPLRDTAFYLVFGFVMVFGLIECNERRGEIEVKPYSELTEKNIESK